MRPEHKIRVLLLERDVGMMIRLLSFFEARPDMEIVEANQNVSAFMDEAASILELRGAMDLLSPDVVIVDLREPLKRDLVWIAKVREMTFVPLIAFTDVALPGKKISGINFFETVARSGGEEKALRMLAYAIRRAGINAGEPERPQALPGPLCKSPGAARLIAMGASAGGTEAILDILSGLPADMPPILVVQHITRGFGEVFARHIDHRARLRAVVAEDGQRIRPGWVYVAPDAMQMRLEQKAGTCFLRCEEGERVAGHMPSIDVLFHSVAEEAGAKAVGVLLTGMGKDGAQGLLHMRQRGAFTIGQDEETSLIYGMPKAAYELGAVARQLPLDKIGSELVKHIRKGEAGNEQNSGG